LALFRIGYGWVLISPMTMMSLMRHLMIALTSNLYQMKEILKQVPWLIILLIGVITLLIIYIYSL
jgi:hypothetical protein